MPTVGPAASCPDITDCISVITVSNLDNGKVTTAVSEACNGSGASPGTGSAKQPFVKSAAFKTIIIFLVVAVILVAVVYVFATTSGTPAPPQLVYITPADVPGLGLVQQGGGRTRRLGNKKRR